MNPHPPAHPPAPRIPAPRVVPGLALSLLLAFAPAPAPSAADSTPTPAPAAEAATLEPASLPYRAVADILEGFTQTREREKLQLAVRVAPARPSAAATPISLELRAPGGTVPLTLSDSGEFVDFPLTPALREANPRIVSNQPKGSLVLRAELTLRYSGRLAETAAWYVDALAQANAVVKNPSGLLSRVSPTLSTLVVGFDPATPASITLRTEAGEKRFDANTNGIARVPLGPDANRKNARITFSAVPRKIIAE